MTLRLSQSLSFVMVAALAAGCIVGCDTTGIGSGQPGPGMPGVPDPSNPPDKPDPDPNANPQCSSAPACDAAITVDPNGPALMITDPAVLAELPLEKVVTQLLQYQGVAWKPEELVQRLFDGMNTDADGEFDDVFHCDSPDNPALFNKSGDTFTCPRAEGQLAHSTGLLKDGDPDSFFPVAVVNRFDLTPIDGSKCGQYRIIYAKRSGLDDPNNRVFLIFEAALANPTPGCLEACRPVAQFWKSLETKSTDEIATHVRTFFFAGIPGFRAAIHPQHFGLGVEDQGYGGTEPGQIRVSMHMQDNWDMRELHFGMHPSFGTPLFTPASVKNNPVASYFGPNPNDSGMGEAYRSQFVWNELLSLAAKDMKDMRMFTSPEFNGVESLLGGEKKNDYFANATSAGDMTFIDALNEQIQAQGLNASCPADDPLDAEAVLKRATTQSCAGCHAPKELIGEDRSIGCGLTWPDSIGQSHVTEKGERSPALKEVFLPHRADVLQTFLQSCDPNAIQGNLQPGGPGGFEEGNEKSGADMPGGAARTLGGSSSH